MNDSFFKKIESKTGVPMEEVFALANAIQYADFKDEKQVRKIIQKVSQVAKKDVPQSVEDELVNSIVTSGKGLNLNDISQMLGGK
ncbi:sporulation protein [Sporosarcina sp. P21c]|uniref:stage VI sporulation protein F n=1 Tax=Sporosarcina TaxID=1569 RepID=UPI000A1607E5|nr:MULTISPECIES: stage VI sporulation protein F [Sporosarcina]ARJ39865.1 sporulation protein [Sporosarcina ureae]PIC66561.1 sporulation protein [Sporosarcina sp. P16a]PIC81992.1 sporulation protein [Sporosarcina sp. P1]PIC89948.1 sporulation protein [Sporosarcina sp. P21c]PIC93142.1 sporulation protein [Sporosarcina sp. P25]